MKKAILCKWVFVCSYYCVFNCKYCIEKYVLTNQYLKYIDQIKE